MKQKIEIQEHGKEWAIICPECLSDKLTRTPIKWETTICYGVGIRYCCKQCNCCFDIKNKGSIKDEAIFKISFSSCILTGMLDIMFWMPILTQSDEPHLLAPAIIFLLLFVISFALSSFYGDA